MTKRLWCKLRALWVTLDAMAARAFVVALKAYRLLLSPWLGNACRFEPSCSRYAIEAMQTHGGTHGSYLMARRVLRCHPGCQAGHDPVPPLRRVRGQVKPEDKTPNTHVAVATPPLNVFTE